MRQGIVPCRPPFRVQRIEEVNRLTGTLAIPGAGTPILPLHIENDDRIRPGQQIGDDNTDALPGARRRFAQDMLDSGEAEETPCFASSDNARDRKSGVSGKGGSAREERGGGGTIENKKNNRHKNMKN